jgi:WD40 repeat protein
MLAFSPTRETILAAAGPASGMLLFWGISDTPGAPLRGTLASSAWHPDVITSLAWNPSEDEIATGCQDGSLRIWLFTPGSEPQTKPLRETHIGEPIRDIAWSSSGELIAVLSESGNIRVLLSRMPNHPLAQRKLPGAQHLAFTLGGTLVAWGANVARAWGNEQSPIFSERRLSRNEVHLCFHQDGCLTATATDRVHFLNPDNLTRTASFKAMPIGAGHWCRDIFYYPQNDECKSAPLIRTNASYLKLRGGPEPVEGVLQTWASPSGNHTAQFDREHFLTIGEGQLPGIQLPKASKPQIVAVSDNSPTATWSEDGLVLNICNLARTNVPTRTETFQDGILDLAFAPKQNVLSVRTRSAVKLIALDSDEHRTYPIEAPAQSFSPIVFSPDGCWLAVCGVDNSICLAPVRSELQALTSGRKTTENIFAGAWRLASPERRAIISLCWNATGERMAAGSAEGFVNCWNVSLLRRQLRLWKLDRDDELLPAVLRFLPIKLN